VAVRLQRALRGIAAGAGAALVVAAPVAASAASPAARTRVRCQASTAIAVAPGQTGVLAPVVSGVEYGPLRCGAMLGKGIQSDSFTVPVSGNTMARYVLYLRSGTLYGTYELTPEQTGLDFYATTWTGRMRVSGGTGAFRGFHGTGVMSCHSGDGIHTVCSDRLSLVP